MVDLPFVLLVLLSRWRAFEQLAERGGRHNDALPDANTADLSAVHSSVCLAATDSEHHRGLFRDLLRCCVHDLGPLFELS
jgi:hypothetical protein